VVDLANFKLISVDWLLGKAKEANDFGYSGSFTQSLGLVFVFVVATGLLCLLGFFMYKLFKSNEKVRKVLEFLANKLLFNSFIRAYIQGYLIFCISALGAVKSLLFDSPFSFLRLSLSNILDFGCLPNSLEQALCVLKKVLSCLA